MGRQGKRSTGHTPQAAPGPDARAAALTEVAAMFGPAARQLLELPGSIRPRRRLAQLKRGFGARALRRASARREFLLDPLTRDNQGYRFGEETFAVRERGLPLRCSRRLLQLFEIVEPQL
jgi:hypothetical protein